MTNSVNKINFLGRDGAHIRLIPENNLWKSGLKKQCPVLIVLDSKLDFGPWLSKFGKKKFSYVFYGKCRSLSKILKKKRNWKDKILKKKLFLKKSFFLKKKFFFEIFLLNFFLQKNCISSFEVHPTIFGGLRPPRDNRFQIWATFRLKLNIGHKVTYSSFKKLVYRYFFVWPNSNFFTCWPPLTSNI